MPVQRSRDVHIWRLPAKNAVTRMALPLPFMGGELLAHSSVVLAFFVKFSCLSWLNHPCPSALSVVRAFSCLSWFITSSASSIEHTTASNNLYISSGSCRSGIYAMVIFPLPANHPASVCALLPHGSTSTQVSHASIASISFLNCLTAFGCWSISRYCCGDHSI